MSDDTIDLLKSGEINTRLLCEMATHKDFVKLLADIEIYVDGIAAMQLQNLNAYVSLARGMVEKKYHPGKNDRHQRILAAAHINENEYFCNIVHNDIDSIIQDIKAAHSKDKESAPAEDWLEEWQKDLDYVSSIQGTPQKRQVALYCRRLGIDYKKLTDVEFEVMIRIMQKSKLMKGNSKGQNRGKKYK